MRHSKLLLTTDHGEHIVHAIKVTARNLRIGERENQSQANLSMHTCPSRPIHRPSEARSSFGRIFPTGRGRGTRVTMESCPGYLPLDTANEFLRAAELNKELLQCHRLSGVCSSNTAYACLNLREDHRGALSARNAQLHLLARCPPIPPICRAIPKQ